LARTSRLNIAQAFVQVRDAGILVRDVLQAHVPDALHFVEHGLRRLGFAFVGPSEGLCVDAFFHV
jgi:hypothetical protein